MRIFDAQTSGGTLELEPHFPRKFVYRTHPVRGSALKVWDLQRHFTRKKQRRNRALEFISQSLLHLLPDQQDLPLVAKKVGAQLLRDPVHTVDGEVHMDRNGCPDMFQHPDSRPARFP